MPTKPARKQTNSKDPPPDADIPPSSVSSASSGKQCSAAGDNPAEMGARWSGGGGAGSGGRAPSTASGSSTHTASTVPADAADVKVKPAAAASKRGGVAGFLRRKPSNKATASATSERRQSDPAPEVGASGTEKKPAKKSATLRGSLFKRKGKTASLVEVEAGPSTEKGRPPSGRASTSPPKAARAASRSTAGSGEVPVPKRKSPSPASRKTPPPSARKNSASSTSDTGSAGKAAASSAAAGPDAADAAKVAAAATTAGDKSPEKPATRGSKALTPEQKEAMKKQWFTAGLSAPPTATRTSARLAADQRTRVSARTAETSEPPAKVSRVSNAAAKFGPTVKAAVKPRPSSPKKAARPARPTSGAEKQPAGDAGKSDAKSPAAAEKPVTKVVKSATEAEKPTESVTKSAAAAEKPAVKDEKGVFTAEKQTEDRGMGDLMGAMAGFEPRQDTKKKTDSTSEKDKKRVTGNSTEKSDASTKAGASGKVSAPVAAADLVNKVVDKAVVMAADETAEAKSEKTSVRRLGDEDTGELGLGGISQKDREEISKRPQPSKPTEADIDFLSSVIDTAPKLQDKKVTPSKQQKKDIKDEGLSDLMDLAMGFEMSAKPKRETAKEAPAKPDLPSAGDMDKFLDLMSVDPVKPPAPVTEKEVTEKHIAEKMWRTGDGDDEKMNELRTRERDFDAPAQALDWDIDDLVEEAVSTKPAKSDAKANEEKSKKESNAVAGKGDKGLSGFDEFMSASLSEKAASGDGGKPSTEKKGDEDKKPGKMSPTDNKSITETKSHGKKPNKAMSAFEDFLTESLSAPVSTAPASPAKEEVISAPKQVSSVDAAPKSAGSATVPKQTAISPSAPVDEEILSSVASSQTTAAPAGKPKSKHQEKEGNTRGSVPDHGHGVRGILYDDSDKTGSKSQADKKSDDKSRTPGDLDDLIRPVKASSTSNAPAREETVVAHAAVKTEAGTKPAGQKLADKHIEKEGDTRGSCPDHGLGVRDLLYDDHDKTGLGKKGADKADGKPRGPALLDDLVVPKQAGASHAQPREAAVKAETSHQSHAEPGSKQEKAQRAEKAHSMEASHGEKDCKSKVCEKHVEKHGDTRGSCPDHGHGVREVLYDDSDKTGRTKPKTDDSKHREPAVLDDLVVPMKAGSSHSAPNKVAISAEKSHSQPSNKHEEKPLTSEKAHSTEASHSEKDCMNKLGEKHVEKHGDTRGSCPDHGHGIRDVLYDDSDKTGRSKHNHKAHDKHREPAILDDLVMPKAAGVSHTAPSETAISAEKSHQSHAEPSHKHEEPPHTAEKAHSIESSHSEKDCTKKRCEKHIEKHGNTRGSCPDHGHGVRDVLYDDSDKTGRGKNYSSSKHGDKNREPAVLDNLIVPKQASKSASAAPTERSPASESEDDDEDSEHVTPSSAAHTEAAAPHMSKNKKRRNRKKKAKNAAAKEEKTHEEKTITSEKAHSTEASHTEKDGKSKACEKHVTKPGDTRGSCPDHGHGVRDVLYDDKDKTGLTKLSPSPASHPREPAGLDDLILPAHASSTASVPAPSHKGSSAAEKRGVSTHEVHVVAAAAAAVHSARPSSENKQKPKKSLSLAGMTDPDPASDSDGEELRRLISSTEALQHQLHACGVLADSKQAEAAQAAAGRELEQLEDQLQRREAKLAATGNHKAELQAAKDQLHKAKQQLQSAGKPKG